MRTAGCALYILKHYCSPFDTLKGAVRIGGDVGSLGAICMGIVGAASGLYDVPQWLSSSLEDREAIEDLASRFGDYVRDLWK